MAVERPRGRKAVEQRRRRLAAEPLCRRCTARGLITAATQWDHVVALANGGSDDDQNGQPLCNPCHLEKTAEDFGHRKPIIGRGIARDGRPTSHDHPWNRGR